MAETPDSGLAKCVWERYANAGGTTAWDAEGEAGV